MLWSVQRATGAPDDFKALFERFRPPASVGVVEFGDGGGSGFLKGFESRPLGEEGAGERGEEITADELQGLGEAVFEGLGEFVGEAGADADELAAFFGEQGDLVGEWIRGGPWLEVLVALVDEEGEGVGIASVVFGARGVEGFPVFLDDGGIDEVEAQEAELAEEVDEVLARLFDAEGDVATGREVLFQLADPEEQGFG